MPSRREIQARLSTLASWLQYPSSGSAVLSTWSFMSTQAGIECAANSSPSSAPSEVTSAGFSAFESESTIGTWRFGNEPSSAPSGTMSIRIRSDDSPRRTIYACHFRHSTSAESRLSLSACGGSTQSVGSEMGLLVVGTGGYSTSGKRA